MRLTKLRTSEPVPTTVYWCCSQPRDLPSGPRVPGLLATQRRELRHAEAELARLGCRLDHDERVRILIPAERDDHQVEGFLEQTCFRPAPSSL